MELDPRKTAVIAVHCQGDIVGSTGAFADFFHAEVKNRGVVKKIGHLLNNAREAGATVIYTKVAFRPDYSDLHANSPLLQIVEQSGCLKEGSELAEIVTDLSPAESDFVVTHQRVGGFVPELVEILEQREITTVLFSGVATNVSVEGTARAASDHGFRVVIAEDACSAATAETHTASTGSLSLLAEIVTTEELSWAPTKTP